MTRSEAMRLSRTIEQAGMTDVHVRVLRERGGLSYDVTALDPQTGVQCVVPSGEAWAERVADAAADWAV